jgi:cytochrome oxidase Cu insertion factor (SCO1/SenC/PrrC family)
MLALMLALIGLALTACGSDKKESAKEGLAVGDAAPAFSLPASDGSTVALADYKGQPVLLFFHMADG